jgi:hypothetical protein
MHGTPLYHRMFALGLTLVLSIAPAARAWPQMAPGLSALIGATLAPDLSLAGGSSARTAADSVGVESASALPRARAAASIARASYAGRDDRGVPRYLARDFSKEERLLLRREFGIEEPGRLFLSDTLPGATLTYDTDWDRGERDLVGSYRIGATSIRRPGETWEELERRLASTSPESFPASTHRADRSLGSLDPTVRPEVARMLAAARAARLRARISEARRSAERQAYLLALDSRLTHTATSRHADGFAVDVVVDDGDLRHPLTRAHWIAFRRWVLANESGTFRLIGAPDASWDWPHIEYVGGPPGFGSIEELLDAAHRCADAGVVDCTAAWRDPGADAVEE